MTPVISKHAAVHCILDFWKAIESESSSYVKETEQQEY